MVSRKSGWAGPLGPAPAWNFSSKPLVIRAGEAGVQTSGGHSQASCSLRTGGDGAVPDPKSAPPLTSKLPSRNWIPKGTLWKEARRCLLDVIAKSLAALKCPAHLVSLLLKMKPGLDLLKS